MTTRAEAPASSETENPSPDDSGSALVQRRDETFPGDLARRVAHRRTELGMSLEELARLAGVDPRYLRYFEHSPNSTLSAGTLLLLALALDTTPIALRGGEVDLPPGRGRAGPHPVLEALTPTQCAVHLSAGGIGRIVFITRRGPIALPVNFEFTDGQVVFSTDEAKADALESANVVGFEIDRVDETLSEGWSVVATGPARRIDDPQELERLSSLDLEAWAGGARHTLVGIRPLELTGRVIVHYVPRGPD